MSLSLNNVSTTMSIIFSVLQIYFGESDYFIGEGLDTLSSTITFHFRESQNPFTVRLSPVTIDTAESMNLGFFINSATIRSNSRATAGYYDVLSLL